MDDTGLDSMGGSATEASAHGPDVPGDGQAADVDRHTEVFGEAVEALFGG